MADGCPAGGGTSRADFTTFQRKLIALSPRLSVPVSLLFALLFICFHGTAGIPGDPPSNQYVKVAAALVDSTLSPGGRGEILITLKPIEGIHINADPAPEFSVDSGSVAKAIGAPRGKKDDRGYLSVGEPVRQEIVIAPMAAPGEHHVRGLFIYYYCSDTEGWCMRYRQAVALTVIVKN